MSFLFSCTKLNRFLNSNNFFVIINFFGLPFVRNDSKLIHWKNVSSNSFYMCTTLKMVFFFFFARAQIKFATINFNYWLPLPLNHGFSLNNVCPSFWSMYKYLILSFFFFFLNTSYIKLLTILIIKKIK